MLYPILPLYMQKIGLSGTVIGLIEGIAEGIAAWGKGYFGQRSDSEGKKKKYIVTGYGLSTLAKLLMAVSVFPAVVYIARLSDRLGKGIRSSPRDGLLATEADLTNAGKVFGLHRSMDTLGAALGPTITLILLYQLKLEYIQIFLFAFVPGLIGWIITLTLAEKAAIPVQLKSRGLFSFFGYFKTSSANYKRIVIPMIIFSVFNSSDFFLILNLKRNGFGDIQILLIYILYNVSFAALSYPAGWLADRLGFKYILTGGLVIFSTCYLMMGMATNILIAGGLFLLYGLYAALTDGIAKAWLSKNATVHEKSSAIGFFNACQAIALVVAGVWTGLMVDHANYETAFFISACGALVAAVLLLSARTTE